MFCTRLANGGLFPTGDPIVPFVISPRFECLNKLTHTHKFIDECMYFGTEAGMEGWRGRPRTTLPSILDNDLRTAGKRLHNTGNLEQLRLLTKEEWKTLTRKIVEMAEAKLT